MEHVRLIVLGHNGKIKEMPVIPSVLLVMKPANFARHQLQQIAQNVIQDIIQITTIQHAQFAMKLAQHVPEIWLHNALPVTLAGPSKMEQAIVSSVQKAALPVVTLQLALLVKTNITLMEFQYVQLVTASAMFALDRVMINVRNAHQATFCKEHNAQMFVQVPIMETMWLTLKTQHANLATQVVLSATILWTPLVQLALPDITSQPPHVSLATPDASHALEAQIYNAHTVQLIITSRDPPVKMTVCQGFINKVFRRVHHVIQNAASARMEQTYNARDVQRDIGCKEQLAVTAM